jgi:hypothetical protein
VVEVAEFGHYQQTPEPGATKMNEQELIAKYKTIDIVEGSLRPGSGKHKGKNTVVVICKCGHSQKVATSDLWLKNCNSCGEKINSRKTRKAAK